MRAEMPARMVRWSHPLFGAGTIRRKAPQHRRRRGKTSDIGAPRSLAELHHNGGWLRSDSNEPRRARERSSHMDMTQILAQTGGLRSMARELGVTEKEVHIAAAALVPAILGGFKKQAQSQPTGLE